MQKEHDVPMAGHYGEHTTRVAVGKTLYWPEMKEDVEHFVCTCVKYQNMKSIYKKKYGLYRPLLIPSESWENVSMDFMTQLFKWNGMDAILMVVD
jgi:hypothetical protein